MHNIFFEFPIVNKIFASCFLDTVIELFDIQTVDIIA